MSSNQVIRALGRLLQFALYAGLFGVLAFFALARTEQGRETLRMGTLRLANSALSGRLEIGGLSGSVPGQLAADQVVVRDAEGGTIARIDSVILHPTWRSLINRTVSIGHVTLVRPRFSLERNASGEWNIADVFRAVTDTSRSNPNPWSFRSSLVNIADGSIQTRSAQPIDSDNLFDWSNASMKEVNARLAIDLGPEAKTVEALDFSARLVEPDMEINQLHGRLTAQEGHIALHDAQLRTARSDLHLNGSISVPDTLSGAATSPTLDIRVDRSTIDSDEMRRVFPALPPLETVTMAGSVRGSVEALVVDRIDLERNASALAIEGTLLGLPDSLDYELAIREGRLYGRDIRSLQGAMDIPSFEHLDRIDFTGYAYGAAHFRTEETAPHWRGAHEFTVETEAGRIEGNAWIALNEEGLSVESAIDLDHIDTGRILRKPNLTSDLTGRIALQGAGPGLSELTGEVELALTRSRAASRSLDTLYAVVTGTPQAFRGALQATEGDGSVAASLEADRTGALARYRVEGATTRLDLGNILRNDSLFSSFNTRFELEGSGISWTNFEGAAEVTFEPSVLTSGTIRREIPAHRSSLSIRQDNAGRPDGSEIMLTGDIATVRITGDVALKPVIRLARRWGEAIAREATYEISKPYRTIAGKIAAPRFEQPAGSHAADSLKARRLALQAHMLRSDILAALWPGLPVVHTDLRAEGRLLLAPDRFGLDIQVNADSLRTDEVLIYDMASALSAESNDANAIARTLQSTLSATVRDMRIRGRRLGQASLKSDFENRTFGITAEASMPGATEPLRLRARMDMLPNRNRLLIEHLRIAAKNQVWTATGNRVIDFYKEAIHIPDIRIAREDDLLSDAEGLHITGTLSAAPQDTLFIHAEAIRMQHVSELTGLRNTVDGQLGGRIAFTGWGRKPELTGQVFVDALTFRGRPLGYLTLDSRYIPGSPNIALQARLAPSASSDGDLLPDQNDLAVNGFFRLPGPRNASQTRDPGALELNVRIRQANAFFFERLFSEAISNVTGYVNGSGYIGGDFSRPIFNADLALHAVRFRVPEFQLAFEATGPLVVDRRGVHLANLHLSDTRRGTAVVGGSILFNDYRFFSFDLEGELNRLNVMNVRNSRELPFYGRIWASGDIELRGPASNALLASSELRTTSGSELYIPVAETAENTDTGFIVFADSTGYIPMGGDPTRQGRGAERAHGERPFVDGLMMDVNILSPEGTTVHLVIDPLLGDVITAQGNGRVQLGRTEGEFFTFGDFNVTSGNYLFTAAGFSRRFIIDSGVITWNGDPLNAIMAIAASYRTRASPEGLGFGAQQRQLIPLVIELDVSGSVTTPIIDLRLSVDREKRSYIGNYEGLEALLNQPERAAQYATSVLLTNSFLLVEERPLTRTSGEALAVHSLSQLLAGQLNRYINNAFPGVELDLNVYGENAQDLGVALGVALQLLDERLIIRGEGVVNNNETRQRNGLEEFVVEVRLGPHVSMDVFYRKEDGLLLGAEADNSANTTGAGLSYTTGFSTWGRLFYRIMGRRNEGEEDDEAPEDDIASGE